MTRRGEVVVVGAGISGTTAAILLARQGLRVDMFERLQDARQDPVEGGMSINLTLAQRGIRVLEELGLLSTVMSKAVPLRGRMIHRSDGTRIYQPYGKSSHELIHAVKRRDLNVALLDAAEQEQNVSLHFNHTCMSIDGEARRLVFSDSKGETQCEVVADKFIIGADGVFSVVRQSIHRIIPADYRQEFLGWGYRELSLNAYRASCLEPNLFHMWPRGNWMLMAVPGWDGSYVCTCVLPLRGEHSFASLRDGDDVYRFFSEKFADVTPHFQSLECSFLTAPVGRFVTTYMNPWHYRGNVVLVGDACHSFVPFYGQGMNASLEDCLTLTSLLEVHRPNVEAAFQCFEETRRPNTDAVADLSKQHFLEISKRVDSINFVNLKKLDILLGKILPNLWKPLYSQIMHSTVPYAKAVRRARLQRIALTYVMAAWIGCVTIAAITLTKRLLRLEHRGITKPDKRRRCDSPSWT